MKLVVEFFVAAIGLLHLYFLILEMFLWTKPVGLKIFHQSLPAAVASKVLAANQGLYNGFLAAGLLWSLVQANPVFAMQLKYFFLSCIAVAGAYGAVTVSRRIFYVQALPALITILLLNMV